MAWSGIEGGPWKGRAYLRKKYPGAFPLSESQIEVLEGLAREAPTNAYRVHKATGKAYSFVFNTLKEAERRKMVVSRKERTEKKTMANIYDLTLESVLFILHRQLLPADFDFTQARKIIEKYESLLPLVFGKWKHFESMKVEKIAKIRLHFLVGTYANNPSSFKKGTAFLPGMETEQLVCWFFYFQGHHFKFGESWIAALKQDEEIKKYAINELRKYQKRLENRNKLIEETVSLLETEP